MDLTKKLYRTAAVIALGLSANVLAGQTPSSTTIRYSPQLTGITTRAKTDNTSVNYTADIFLYQNKDKETKETFVRQIDKNKEVVRTNDKIITDTLNISFIPLENSTERIDYINSKVNLGGKNYVPVSIGKRKIKLVEEVQFEDKIDVKEGVRTRTTSVSPLENPTVSINGIEYSKIMIDNSSAINTLPFYLMIHPEIITERKNTEKTGTAIIIGHAYQPTLAEIFSKEEIEKENKRIKAEENKKLEEKRKQEERAKKVIKGTDITGN